jgi:hypothetical protein
LHVQVRSERGEVRSFTLDPSLACFITLLPHSSVNYGPDQGGVGFKSIGEMIRHVRGNQAPQQQCAEHLVTAANISIAEPVDEFAAAHSYRSGAIQDESAYRVFVFAEARLNYCRTHCEPPSGGCPGRGLAARSGALVVVEAATS